MEFVDLKAQQARIRDSLEARIAKVLDHGQYILGPEVRELENELAAFVGVEHCLGVASGTDALLMGLMAADVGPGDAVFTTPFTFVATAETIRLVGATPVFADIDERTFNIDPAALEAAIEDTKRSGALVPKAVVTVDLFGLNADYARIEPLCERHGLFLLEDAAQAFGATSAGRRAGSFGGIAATSFFPAKPLGCYGDGGAVFTRSAELARVLDSIRVHGKGEDKYDNVRIGINGRLDTLQAAVLLAKLELFEEELELRQRVAGSYERALHNHVHTPLVPAGEVSAWAQYSICSDARDRIRAALADAGIPSAIYYERPLHLQTAFSDLGYRGGQLPRSESTAERVLSLPMHPYLSDDDIERICRVVIEALS
ncbi:MAG: DegT/DnrJ/EryC1/StrS aminotransferase family protein [Gammaproteobacteria bacterium]|jgi:UDP-2-acetamido-2-deoxy-ribo-hexuluronate aminotransferase